MDKNNEHEDTIKEMQHQQQEISNDDTKIKPKKVDFNSVVAIRGVLQKTYYTPEEIENCWFHRKDRERIRKEMKMVVQSMEKQNDVDDCNDHHHGKKNAQGEVKASMGLSSVARNDDGTKRIKKNFPDDGDVHDGGKMSSIYHDDTTTTRGLEYHTTDGLKLRSQRRLRARLLVLAEQARQKRVGINDENQIAVVYRQHSASSQLHAHLMGIADEREQVRELQQQEQQQQQQQQQQSQQRQLLLQQKQTPQIQMKDDGYEHQEQQQQQPKKKSRQEVTTIFSNGTYHVTCSRNGERNVGRWKHQLHKSIKTKMMQHQHRQHSITFGSLLSLFTS